MFYVLKLKKELDVHPKYFGKLLREYITDKLIQEVRSCCAEPWPRLPESLVV